MEIRNFGWRPTPTLDTAALGGSLSAGGSGLPRKCAGNFPKRLPRPRYLRPLLPYSEALFARLGMGFLGRLRPARESETMGPLLGPDYRPRTRLRGRVQIYVAWRRPANLAAGAPIREPQDWWALGYPRAAHVTTGRASGRAFARVFVCILRGATRRSRRQWCLLGRAPGRPRAVNFVLRGGLACVRGRMNEGGCSQYKRTRRTHGP